MEGLEGQLEVDCVVGGVGLDVVIFEDWFYGEGTWTIISRRIRMENGRTHAQTWVPDSGMIVNRTLLLSNRTQATLPSEERDAVSSAWKELEISRWRWSKTRDAYSRRSEYSGQKSWIACWADYKQMETRNGGSRITITEGQRPAPSHHPYGC